jgi:hypothetical protein
MQRPAIIVDTIDRSGQWAPPPTRYPTTPLRIIGLECATRGYSPQSGPFCKASTAKNRAPRLREATHFNSCGLPIYCFLGKDARTRQKLRIADKYTCSLAGIDAWPPALHSTVPSWYRIADCSSHRPCNSRQSIASPSSSRLDWQATHSQVSFLDDC